MALSFSSWIKSDQFLARSNFSKHHLIIHTLKHLDLFLPESHFFGGDHFGSLFVGQFLLEGDSSIAFISALISLQVGSSLINSREPETDQHGRELKSWCEIEEEVVK